MSGNDLARDWRSVAVPLVLTTMVVGAALAFAFA